MNLIIKCSSDCCILDGSTPVLSWGFSVRRDHRVVHQASGVLADEGRLASEGPAVEAVCRALSWLGEQTVDPCSVLVRSVIFFCQEGLPLDDLLGPLRAAGWGIELQPVTPEYVSEATALAWAAAGAVLKACGRKDRPVVLGTQAVQYAWDAAAENDLTLVCDGGYRRVDGRAGLAVYGFLVWEHFRLLHRDSGVVCVGPAASSQMAELAAAVSALRWVTRYAPSVTQVELRSDCLWLVQMLTGRPTQAPHGSVMLLREAERLLARLERRDCKVAVWRVPRPMVAEADRMCREEYGRHANPGRLPLSTFLHAAQG